MLNKLWFLLVFSLSSALSAQIVGIGQVGDKYIYKINGVLVSLSAGDIVAGCEVRRGSGLQCDDTYPRIANNKSALESLEEKMHKMQELGDLHSVNIQLKQQNLELQQQNSRLKNDIIKRNKAINRLSNALNSR
jgi:hypothetical protein